MAGTTNTQALVGFYSVHNPERIAKLDSILTQYAGKEDLLIERLEQKYSADLSYARRAMESRRHHGASGDDMPRHQQSGAPRPGQAVASSPGHEQQQQQLRFSSSTGSRPGSSHSLSPQPPEPFSRKNGQPASGRPAAPRPPPPGSTTDSVPPQKSTGGGGSGGNTSSSYMTYLADQIRSNVEGLLPSSSGGGGGSASTTDPHLPPAPSGRFPGSNPGVAAVSPSSASLRPHRDPAIAAVPAAEAAATLLSGPGGGASVSPRFPLSSAGAGARHASVGPGVWGSNPATAAAEAVAAAERGGGFGTLEGTVGRGGGGGAAGGERRQQQGPDQILTARVKALEEERAGLLAACRRLQGKAEAAAREVRRIPYLRGAEGLGMCIGLCVFACCGTRDDLLIGYVFGWARVMQLTPVDGCIEPVWLLL